MGEIKDAQGPPLGAWARPAIVSGLLSASRCPYVCVTRRSRSMGHRACRGGEKKGLLGSLPRLAPLAPSGRGEGTFLGARVSVGGGGRERGREPRGSRRVRLSRKVI